MSSKPRLTDARVQSINTPGLHHDAGGLYLKASELKDGGVGKSWLLRWSKAGKSKSMGFGSYPAVGLKLARELAAEARAVIARGKCPLAEREAQAAVEREEQRRADMPTFAVFAEQAIERYAAGWRESTSHDGNAVQWRQSLRDHAYPVLGDVPVDRIDTAMVLKVLTPMWSRTPETASRVRQRIERILDAAAAAGHRDIDRRNPACWRGCLDAVLPARAKVAKVEPHASLPWRKVPAFVGQLRASPYLVSARLCEFIILTCARASEARLATFSEIRDIEVEDGKTIKAWVVPAERMKVGREHRVPLSSRAIEIVGEMRALSTDGRHVFAGRFAGTSLSARAHGKLLQQLGHDDITTHGFRSSFRVWAAERMRAPNDIAEHALAHTVGNVVERAYQRSDLLAQRLPLMQAWADHCSGVSSATVLPFAKTA